MEMEDIKNVKDILQLYSNIQRLDVLNNKIKEININDEEIMKLKSNVILFNETMIKIIKVYEKALFTNKIQIDSKGLGDEYFRE